MKKKNVKKCSLHADMSHGNPALSLNTLKNEAQHMLFFFFNFYGELAFLVQNGKSHV